ncbi:MAG: DUF1926 domain-containing protein [Deltaproteobacteria bacterium]|nr:DUF1926 domain-containing protein [Deltaproteobacteria bacterium]
MAKARLLLIFHNHQPTGNIEDVFRNATSDCYEPLVDTMFDFPELRFSLHTTGPLWNWLEENRPHVFEKMAEMVSRKQLEILGGGFYEPMLAVLPEKDAIGQLTMMRERIKERFNYEAQGLWTAERVWEPDLARIMSMGGYRYTLLDDRHFHSAGLKGELDGYYVTEKAGYPLAVFPISQSLRYAIPFQSPSDAFNTIVRLAEEKGGNDVVLTYGDDGEKFGVWPGTKNLVWERGWLREFFSILRDNSETVSTSTPSEIMSSTPSKGQIYLPTSSYSEMGEWSLTPDAQDDFKALHRILDLSGKAVSLYKKKQYIREYMIPLLDLLDKIPRKWLETYLKFMDHGGIHLLKGSRFILSRFEKSSALVSRISTLLSAVEDLNPAIEGSNILLHIGNEMNEIISGLENLVEKDIPSLESFIQGGIWQGFLSKYHESNLVHKRMLHISSTLNRLELNPPGIDTALLIKARDHLYQAQCNCAYWHGIFGGLYMVHLRHALYHHLLVAEHLMDRYSGLSEDSVVRKDFDADLIDEVILSGPKLFAVVKPSSGAGLFELDLKERYFNLTNVMTRMEEGYHRGFVVRGNDEDSHDDTITIHHHVDYVDESFLEKRIYDAGPRFSFQDQFLSASTDIKSFSHDWYSRKYTDIGDFAFGKYSISEISDAEKYAVLEKTGLIGNTKTNISKKFSINGSELKVEYLFSLPSGGHLNCFFASESSFTLLGHNTGNRRMLFNGESPEGTSGMSGAENIRSNITSMGMKSTYDGFSWEIDWGNISADVITFPFYSLSKSETGVEMNYQGTSMTPFFLINISDEETFSLEFTLKTDIFPPEH